MLVHSMPLWSFSSSRVSIPPHIRHLSHSTRGRRTRNDRPASRLPSQWTQLHDGDLPHHPEGYARGILPGSFPQPEATEVGATASCCESCVDQIHYQQIRHVLNLRVLIADKGAAGLYGVINQIKSCFLELSTIALIFLLWYSSLVNWTFLWCWWLTGKSCPVWKFWKTSPLRMTFATNTWYVSSM